MEDKNKTQLGKLLLKQKLVKPNELASLLEEQPVDNERLASKVVEKGLASENSMLDALSAQHGLPGINLEEIEIDLSSLEFIPQDIAEKHLVLPVLAEGDSLHLAMADPRDARVVEEIEFVTGKRVFPRVALHKQILKTIEACYSAYASGKKTYRGAQFATTRSAPVEAVRARPEKPAAKGAPVATGTIVDKAPVSITQDLEEIDIDMDVPDADMETDGVKPLDLPEETEAAAPSRHKPAQTAARVAPSKTLSASTNSTSARARRTLKVLVVDDEDEIRLLVSKILTEKGYAVVTASRGYEAIQTVQRENPDMVILDAMLPEVHGFDICKRLKGSAKYGHIPVIMISAIYRGWRYAQDLKESYGVDDFIEKPFKVNEIVKTVAKYSPTSPADSAPTMEGLSQEAERILNEGIAAYRQGNIDKAIDLLKKGIKIDPLAFKLHYHLALLLGRKGLNYQAIRELENSLEIDPNNFSALKNLAVLFQKAGFKYKAIETWERALGSCSDDKTREDIKQLLVNLL